MISSGLAAADTQKYALVRLDGVSVVHPSTHNIRTHNTSKSSRLDFASILSKQSKIVKMLQQRRGFITTLIITSTYPTGCFQYPEYSSIFQHIRGIWILYHIRVLFHNRTLHSFSNRILLLTDARIGVRRTMHELE